MAVVLKPTEIPEVLMVDSPLYRDDRGFFTETYNYRTWKESGFEETFLQDNLSCSAKGTLRGLHYQLEPHAMGKLVRVLKGAIFDVAVDIRTGSPTFGQYVGRTLKEGEPSALWVPAGFAHGFLALDDDTLVYYKCTNVYAPEAERSLLYNDPGVGIAWPFEPTCISDKDAAAPLLKDAEYNFAYTP